MTRTKEVWFDDAYIKDFTGIVNLTTGEYQSISNAINDAEDYLRQDEANLNASVLIENNSIFFIDHEKVSDLKSKISQFLDVHSLSLLLGGKSTFRHFFKRINLIVKKLRVVTIIIARSPKKMMI